MAYIQIELAGQKTFGGYLKIDGEKADKAYRRASDTCIGGNALS